MGESFQGRNPDFGADSAGSQSECVGELQAPADLRSSRAPNGDPGSSRCLSADLLPLPCAIRTSYAFWRLGPGNRKGMESAARNNGCSSGSVCGTSALQDGSPRITLQGDDSSLYGPGCLCRIRTGRSCLSWRSLSQSRRDDWGSTGDVQFLPAPSSPLEWTTTRRRRRATLVR